MSLFSSKSKGEIEKLIEENDELKNTVHSFVQRHNSLTELDEKLTKAKIEYDQLSDKISHGLEKILEINSEIEHKSLKVAELDNRITEIDEINRLYTQLSDKHQKLEATYGELENKNKEVEETIAKLVEREENIRATTALAESELEDINEGIKNKELQFKELSERQSSEENQKAAQIKVLDDRISLSEEIKSNLDTSIAALVSQLSEKEKIFAEFIDKRDSIIDELRLRQKEFDEHDYKFNYQRDIIKKLEDEFAQLSERKSTISEEIRKFELVKIELQEEILKLRGEEERLAESLAVMQQSADDLEKRKLGIEESRIAIENNFSSVLQKFTDEISSQKNLINTLRQEIFEKEKELSAKEKILLEKATQIAEYGGISKVLQKERAATEQMMQNLKEEYGELNNEYAELRERTNIYKSNLQQLKSDAETLELKKAALEQELTQLLSKSSSGYNILEENKKHISNEISSSLTELDKLRTEIAGLKSELRELKLEIANTSTQKEEYSSKVSELIAMEKNLKNKIADYEKKIDGQSREELG